MTTEPKRVGVTFDELADALHLTRHPHADLWQRQPTTDQSWGCGCDLVALQMWESLTCIEGWSEEEKREAYGK